MKVIVVGLGVQGEKRQFHAGDDFVASVDPIKPAATYRHITDVPLDLYDAALVCLPDKPKFEIIYYLLSNNKHVLVEKPLWTETDAQILELQNLAIQKNLVCYTAYNHRFEPHFVHMKELLASGKLGTIYYCRLFYGNGTARLVRNSDWRDHGAGVLPDLGSHLLDTVNYWFNIQPHEFEIVAMNHFENRSPDHVVLCNTQSKPQFNFEMTLLSWRNHFVCDIFAEHGSAHIESLCKWGPSSFTYRQRILPSGKPPENTMTLVQNDPTWALEYTHFKNLILKGAKTDLSTDLWIQQTLNRLTKNHFQSTITEITT